MTYRPFGRTRAAVGLARAAMLVPPWLMLPPESRLAKRLESRFYTLIGDGFGLRPAVHGTPAGPGTMLVANHISWADIIAVAAVVDADFVAKADVAAYPGLGALATRRGTIFIDRDRRSQAAAQTAMIRRRLLAGRRVALFPEGTTSDGRGVLPFRSSLFAAADESQRVQPVSIVYTAADGALIAPHLMDAIAWLGDEALLPNAAALARVRAGVTLRFHTPVAAGDFSSRKALTDHCRDAVLGGMRTITDCPRI